MRRWDKQRGAAMLPTMIVIVALVAIAATSASTVQSGISSAAAERHRVMALYAAESGIAAGKRFLSDNLSSAANWNAYVSANNDTPVQPTGIVGNLVQSGDTGNPLDPAHQTWFEATILNNTNDTGFVTGTDDDARVILQVRGHGPNNALVILAVEVTPGGASPIGIPCPAYAQKNLSALGSGFNPCLTQVSGTTTTVFAP